MDQLPKVSSSLNNVLADVAPLSGVVHRLEFEPIGAANQFRRYGGSLTTTSRIGGATDGGVKYVHFRVGRRSGENNLKYLGSESTPKHAQVVELNETLHSELTASIRKYMNVSPDVRKADLSGVMYRLAAGLAYYSVHGSLTTSIMRGGNTLRVRAMSTMMRAMPSEGVVFVPRMVDLVDCPAAFTAICSAVAGEGGSVVTDMVEINPATNAARIPRTAGMELAYGCLVALRMLLNMYDISGYGAVAGYAVAKGVHSVLTVVGHTDEGGLIRDVLRRGSFQAPFGGIYCESIAEYVHFPIFDRGSKAGLQALIDGLALKTAGASALADPLVRLGDRYYPTVFSVGDETKPGEQGDLNDIPLSKRLVSSFATGSGRYCERYVELLGEIICGSAGGATLAASAMAHSMHILASEDVTTRHCQNRTIAPYYWVEPTTLFKERDTSDATVQGYGVMAGLHSSYTQPAYPKHEILVKGTFQMGMAYEHRSMRTVPGLVHMYMHESDGLAGVIPYRMRPTKVALPGGGVNDGSALEGDVEAAMRAQNGMDKYGWGHGSSQIPSPAEFMYIGERVGVKVVLGTPDDEGFGVELAHVISPADAKGEVDVSYLATRPCAMGLCTGMALAQRIRNSRGRAEFALARLRDRVMAGVCANASNLTMQFEEPGAFEMHTVAAELAEAEEVTGIEPPTVPVDSKPLQGGPQRVIYTDQSQRLPSRRSPIGAAGSGAAEEVTAGGTEGQGPEPAPGAEVSPDVEEDDYEEADASEFVDAEGGSGAPEGGGQ